MPLQQTNPFHFLLEKAEETARPRSPFIVRRQSKTRILENLEHISLTNIILYKRINSTNTFFSRNVSRPIWFICPDPYITHNTIISNIFFIRNNFRVYDKKVTLSGKVAHAAVRAAALNEERLREA